MCPIMKTIAIVKKLEDGTKVTIKLPVCRPLMDQHIKEHHGKICVEDLKPCLCNFRLSGPNIPGLEFLNPESWPIDLQQSIERVVKDLPEDLFSAATTEELEERLEEILRNNGLLGGDDE